MGLSAVAITDSGVILSNFSGKNILYNNGAFTPLTTFGADPILGLNGGQVYEIPNTVAINDAGQVAGSYTLSRSFGSPAYSFLDTAGVITPIVVPGSRAGSTVIHGISNSGVIAGDYKDAVFTDHAFLDDNGIYTTVNIPGTIYTALSGVNDAGDIIGVYTPSNSGPQSFLGVPVMVPEPASAALLGMGVAALSLIKRQRRMPVRSPRI